MPSNSPQSEDSPQMPPVSRVVPPRNGIAWIVQSLALLRAQPARLFLIAMLLQLMLGLTQLPLIGLLIVISVPALSAGLLQAFQVTAGGRNPSPFLLFQPLLSGARSGRMLAMGALMFALGLLTVSLVLSGNETLLDPDLLSRIEQGDVEALVALDPAALQSMVLAFLIGIAVSGTLSYMAIPLIWFHDRKLAAALGEGLKALVVNWRPFLLLSLGLAAVLVPISLAAGALFVLAASAGVLSFIVMGLVMILLLAFQLMIFGTQFCAFRDIFGIETGQAGSDPQDEGQLVA